MSSLRGKHPHLPCAASIAGVLLFHAVLVAAVAQPNTIGFAGRDAVTLSPVVLDSVRIFSLTAQRDTLLLGGQRFDINWLVSHVGILEGPTFQLGTNYPNGFSGRTLFEVVLPAASATQVSVHSLRGERCATYSAEMDAGVHRFEFNAGALPPGVYLVAASAGGVGRTMKIMLLDGNGEGSPAIIHAGSAALQGTPAGAMAGASVYHFIGFAKSYAPDTMRFITPISGTTYTFDLDALGIPGRIVTGAFTPLLQQIVPPSGATIEVNKSGDAFHGLKLIVADSAYPDARTFEFSSAPVLGHSLDTNFRIISPMLRVKNGGGYSGVPMSIRIPVRVPPGDFAMGFLYDEKTGDIEGLPILELDSAQVTVMTRHFATSTVTSFAKTSGVSDLSSLANIFVISVKESFLNKQAVINTGFKPKTDDWEFVNEGSYLSPEGHCAGQSMTMMWYYYQQKLRGKPQLFHLLDMSKSDDLFWQDNPTGYRFASVIQKDIDFNSLSRQLIGNLLDRGSDVLFWNAFLASMILTGEPQYVSLRRYNANREFQYGHAIVAHKINVPEGKIFVTDPNYPGTERVITYSNGSFTPYNTKQNTTQADPEPYQGIGCFHKSSMIDWSTINARWKQVQDSTIGTVAPNAFPSYIIRTTDSRQATITESAIATADTIGVEVECATCQRWYTGSDHLTTFKIRLGESRIAASDINGKLLLEDLRPGENPVTIEIDNWSPDGSFKTYLDFRKLTIWYYALRVLAARVDSVPVKKPGDKNTDYTFVASMPGGGPKKFRVDWSFGDGSPREVRTNDSTVTHKWQADGEYLVTARLYDDASGRFITSVSVTAKIGVFEMLSVEPTKDTVGAIVRIAGRGFGPVKGTFERVWFTDAAGPQWQVTATVRAWGDSLIEATVPRQAATGWVHVDIRGSKQDSLAFTVIPKVTEMSPPRSWFNGPIVFVYGAGFGATQGSSRLTIAGRPVDSILQWTDTRIDFKVSEGLYSGPLVVTVGASASAPAHMTIGTMAWLKNTSTMQANFSAMMTKKKSPDNTTLDGSELWELDTAPLSGSIAWNGLSFALSTTSSTGANQTTSVEFNGTVDSTGQVLKTAYIKKTVTDGAPPTRQTVFEYTVTDLPVKQANQTAGTVAFSMSGAALQSHMSGIAYTFTSSIPPAYGWTYVSTDWNSTAPKPSLWVTFKK